MHFILCISKMVIRSLSIFPSFHPLHPMASNPAHVQGMISPQEGRGGARWSCNRAGGGFSYSTDAAGSWSKMALGSPLNLIEISDQWKKMKHNKWNFKGYPPSEISFIKGWWCFFISAEIRRRIYVLKNSPTPGPRISPEERCPKGASSRPGGVFTRTWPELTWGMNGWMDGWMGNNGFVGYD